MAKRNLIIEGGSIAEKNMSGVGHTALYLIKALANNEALSKEFDISIVVPFNKVHFVEAHALPKNIHIKKMYLPGKIMNGLVRFGIVPYMDVFFGKGVYLFPNFKNWPLLFSKNITYVHDVYFKVRPEHIEPRNLSMLQGSISAFIKRASMVVGVSKHAKSEIEHYFPAAKGKTGYVYNGVDTDLFYRRDAEEVATTVKKYGLVVNKYFLFFSNIEPRKNVEKLLEAYEIYCHRIGNKDVALILIGGMGWGNESILAKIQQLQADGYPVIKPSHYVPDEVMPALISGAKALVHPALYEGFGLTPLEAMACATPIIIGNNSSLPEVVGEGYDKYVAIDSPEAIAQAMLTIDTYPQSLLKDGVVRAGLFKWADSARKLTELIRSL